MKKRLILILICIFFISGCAINIGETDSNQKNELGERNRILETELEEKNNYIRKMEEKLFPIFANVSLEFVRGQTQGDVQKLREVVGDNVLIVEDNNQIYGIYKNNGTEIEFMLYNGNREFIYKDMIIQRYRYSEESEEYIIHMREFFEYQNGGSICK